MKNCFYLIAGLLLCILAVTHTLFGLQTALPILHGSDFENSIKTIFTFQLHMIGVQDLVYGITAIIMAFQKSMVKVRFTAWVIIIIMFVRWVIMALTTIVYHDSLTDLLTSSIAFLVLIILLFLGNRVKEK
jgi:hypothetical protein